MRLQAKLTFAMRDLDRLNCIQSVIDGQLRLYQAADRLRLTMRQLRRLVQRYEREGPVGLISRHRNRLGNRGLEGPLAHPSPFVLSVRGMVTRSSRMQREADNLRRPQLV